MKGTGRGITYMFVAPLFAALLTATAFGAHPAEGYPVGYYHPEGVLATNPQDWSLEDLTFSGELADVTSLSWEEQYMVLGLDFEEVPKDVSALPWITLVTVAAEKIDEMHGYIPLQLTPSELRKLPAYANRTDDELAIFKSPISNDWPYLQQENHSPGDLYMRRLETHEISYYASLSPRLQRLWIAGYDIGMEVEHEIPISICGGIYYARIYGYEGPINEDFRYTITRR